MKNYLLLPLAMLISSLCFAQDAQNTSNAEPKKVIANETIKAKPQPFIYRIESDNPDVKLLIALSKDDISKIENNIREYEKQNNITDRVNNSVYS